MSRVFTSVASSIAALRVVLPVRDRFCHRRRGGGYLARLRLKPTRIAVTNFIPSSEPAQQSACSVLLCEYSGD